MRQHYRKRYIKKEETATIELTLDKRLIDLLITTMKKYNVSFTVRYVPKTLGEILAQYQAKQEEAFLRTLEQFTKLVELINRKK